MRIAPDVYQKIVTAKLFKDKNFHEPIGLDQISREAYLSQFHFHRLFTRIYRRTPHQYLTQKRIGQARQWLADKEFTVSEICNNVGFESIGPFSTLFKKEISYAPQYYRNRALLKQQQVRQQPKSFIPHCFVFEHATHTQNSSLLPLFHDQRRTGFILSPDRRSFWAIPTPITKAIFKKPLPGQSPGFIF